MGNNYDCHCQDTGCEDCKPAEKIGSEVCLNDLLYLLDLWKGEGQKRRENEKRLKKENPTEASMEGLIAVIFERHVVEVNALIGKQA